MAIMDNIEEVISIAIGLVVAIFLSNTGRVLQAIELCKECSILQNNVSQRNEEQSTRLLDRAIKTLLFKMYSVISDHTNAERYARELLVMFRDSGLTAQEGMLSLELANMYTETRRFEEAKELYERASDIMKDTGLRQGESVAKRKLGCMFKSFGEYQKAKEYLEKALAITLEIGDRQGEAMAYAHLGTVFQALREYQKAKEYLERALFITREIGDRQGEAMAYAGLANVFTSLGEFQKVKEHLERALEITVEIGNRQTEAAVSLGLGALFQVIDDYRKAKEYLEKGLPITVEIGNRRNEAAAYLNLGTVFNSLGEYEKAKEHLEKALPIAITVGDRQTEAEAYVILGTVFNSLGEYQKAKEYLEKALAIAMEIGDRQTEASAYVILGTVFKSFGEYQKAKEYLEKALAFAMEIGDREREASAYVHLGHLFHSLGEYQKAKEHLERAIEITVEIRDKKQEALACEKLGPVFKSLGKYEKAEEYLEKSLAITMEIGDRKGEAAAYVKLGPLFKSLGKYEKAKEYLEKSLAITLEIGDRKGELAAYANLAVVSNSLGEYQKANEYLEKCQKARPITGEIGDRVHVAGVYINLGDLFNSLGEYQKAKEYFEKALPITLESGDRENEAVVYVSLGTVFTSLGYYQKAAGYAEKARKISLEIGFKEGIAASTDGLGHVQAALGAYEKAKKYAEEALAIYKETGNIEMIAYSFGNLGMVFIGLDDYVTAEEYLNKALSLNSDGGDNMGELYNLLCLTLSKLQQFKYEDAFFYIFRCIKKIEKLRNFLKHNDHFQISFLDVHGRFPYMMLSDMFLNANKPKDALYCEEMRRARALADLMATRYSVKKDIFTEKQPWFGNVKIVMKESKCNCLYISYTMRQVMFWVLETSGNNYHRVLTVSEDTLRPELVADLDGLFNTCFRWLGISPVGDNRKPSQGNEIRDTETSLCFLYKTIIAPVADLLTEPEIIIVPDRCLYQVPFAALRVEPGGKYLSETFRFRIVPSLTTLKLIRGSPADYHSQTGALIVGDPEVGKVLYNGKPKDITALPCARKEAEMVGRLLDVQPLLGERATKQAVLEAIKSVSLIHFAAHGSAESGQIALSPKRTTDGTPKEEDYLLTMSDISKVQLRAKLVVLSCCHTGRGQVRAEGIVGIARAFLGSGARSVLVALWALDDTATEQLMTRFYEHLVRGESASESLHHAMKWMRSNGFTKVSEWAPFVLIGDDVTFEFKSKGTFISEKVFCTTYMYYQPA